MADMVEGKGRHAERFTKGLSVYYTAGETAENRTDWCTTEPRWSSFHTHVDKVSHKTEGMVRETKLRAAGRIYKPAI
jgi:hypothetical protein